MEKMSLVGRHISAVLLVVAIALLSRMADGAMFNDNIAVEGLVYCNCNFAGYIKSLDASPLPGAKVRLRCKIGSSTAVVVNGTTDANGYFLVQTKMIAKYVGHTCQLSVVSSPRRACYVPPQLGVKGKGAKLIYEGPKSEDSVTVTFFSAGLIRIGPSNSSLCPKKP
ncbi:non-classical arabinogalactan protein 31-like [Typha latifolia]|uniref:non-classical arabinogalactan protein 31-like n=1 Tax=Typha latifolia TaxID=4733 RepID=UPI003C2D2A0F